MKIDQQNVQQNSGAGSSQQTGGAQQVSGGRGGAPGARSSYGLGLDSVELSNLTSAVQAYTAGSPARTSALNQIGQDVQSGRYRVDNLAVSQGIIADALIH